MDKLGLIAGGGDLPIRIWEACRAQGRPVFVIRLKGYADETLQAADGVDLALGEFGKCLDALKKAKCGSVCLAGKVSRPDFSTFKVDFKGMTVLPGIVRTELTSGLETPRLARAVAMEVRSACAASRRPSTSTIPAPTTSISATRLAAPAPS